MRIDFDDYIYGAIAFAVAVAIAFAICGCSTVRPEDMIIPPEGEPQLAAVCIGLNRVNPSSIDYKMWDGYLPDCELDARRFADMCEANDIPITLILGNDATVANVKAALLAAAKKLPRKSTLIVTHSGHGMDDGLRQKLCLYDRMLKDTEVAHWMEHLGDIRVLWVCDTCHAAGMYRCAAPVVFDRDAMRGISCELILIAGCSVGESSLSTGDGGLLSKSIIATVRDGASPQGWFDRVVEVINPNRQRPRLIKYGPVSDEFLNGPILR